MSRSSLRERLERAHAGAVGLGWEPYPQGLAAAYDAALSMIAEKDAKVAESLSLLERGVPGTVVEGEGFRWRLALDGPWDLLGTQTMSEDDSIMPTLRALVQNGATVTVPEGA